MEITSDMLLIIIGAGFILLGSAGRILIEKFTVALPTSSSKLFEPSAKPIKFPVG
jgi:hypothetical protein